MDPDAVLGLVGKPALARIAAAVRTSLQRAMDAI